MSDQPLVSVIIPTYNRAHLIGETLDSVLAQTYPNWECIIVDDGSTDNTDEVVGAYVEKDARFKYYHRPDEHLPGGNGARNYGFKMSIGKYIQWFDSDDLMLPKKLEVKVKSMLEHEVDFVVCENAEIISHDPYAINKRWEIKSSGNILLNHLKSNIAFTTAGPFFDKHFLEQKLLFNEEVRIGQEWEFYSRLLTFKPKVEYVFQILFHFRNIETGIRGVITKEKYFNRCETEKKLFKFINSSGYFKKNTIEHYKYQQFKFYLSLRRFHYLRHNIKYSSAISYLITNLNLISYSYLLSNSLKAIKQPSFMKRVINMG